MLVKDAIVRDGNSPDVPVGQIFAFSILGSIFLVEFCSLAWEVLWIDILKTNPHRTIEDALSLPFIMAPILVLFLLVGRLVFALIAVIIGAKFLFQFRNKGTLSLFHLLILIGLSLLLIVVQDITIPTYHLFTATDEQVLRSKDLLRMTKRSASYFLPGVFLAWFLVRRSVSKSSP